MGSTLPAVLEPILPMDELQGRTMKTELIRLEFVDAAPYLDRPARWQVTAVARLDCAALDREFDNEAAARLYYNALLRLVKWSKEIAKQDIRDVLGIEGAPR